MIVRRLMGSLRAITTQSGAALCAATVLTLAAPVSAQEIKPLDVHQDPHGIDLTTNNVSTAKVPSISIPAAPELAFQNLTDWMPVIEVTTGTPQPGSNSDVYRVSAGSLASDAFSACNSEVCYSAKGNGSKLLGAGGDGEDGGGPILGLGGYTYVQGGTGRSMSFWLQTEMAGGNIPTPVKKFLAAEVSNPGGRNLSFEYDSKNISGLVRHRPSRVISTSGYELRFTYFSNQGTYSWGQLKKVELVKSTSPTVILASLDYQNWISCSNNCAMAML